MRTTVYLAFATAAGLLVASAALLAPRQPPQIDEFEVVGRVSKDILLIRDNRTTCEYLLADGGITLRSDGYGNVTPNCPGSRGYTERTAK